MTRRPRGAGNARGGRGGGRGGGGITPPALPPLLGLTGFTGSAYAQTVIPGGVQGVATGFWVALPLSVISQAVSTNRTPVGTLGSGVGWEIRVAGTNSLIFFVASNGVGTAVNSTAFTIPAGYVGKEMMALFVHTGAGNELITYVDAVQMGAPVACVGYTPNTSRMRFGARLTGSQPASDLTIYGVAGGHAVPTLAQVQQMFADFRANRRLAAMAGVATQGAWNVTDIVSVLDSIGTDHMPVTGTPTLVTKPNPVFTWAAPLVQRDILLAGQSNARDAIVPPFAAGHTLARAAYGGTDLVEWAVDGALFNLAMDACAGLTITELWWIQGESDAATSDLANAYEARLVTLLAGFRARLGANVKARIGLLNSGGSAAFTATVRQAHINVCAANPLNLPFDMNQFTSFGFDGTHYSNPAGYTAIGNALVADAGGLV